MLRLAALFSVAIGLIACSENDFVEYKPHYLSANNEHQVYGNPELDSVTFNNTVQVLKYYGHNFKTKNGNVILIAKELNEDWQLLYNYTKKAHDAQWLHTHSPE